MVRLADLAAEFELGLRPSKQTILDCLTNADEVQQLVRIPVSDVVSCVCVCV